MEIIKTYHYRGFRVDKIEACPFWSMKVYKNPKCCLTKKICRFNLTEVEPPKTCPLRKEDITIILSLHEKLKSEIYEKEK